ncbi:hypothetical protein ACWEWG_17070 [Streptomyces sp. NPDC003758]
MRHSRPLRRSGEHSRPLSRPPHRPRSPWRAGLARRALRAPLAVLLPCALAAAMLLLQAPAAALPVDPGPTCSGRDQHTFPLAARIRGGPRTYAAGGAAHTWYIDLKNTSSQTCGNIHPVLVLVDTRRALTAAQAELEFFEGDRPHPVTFERTDRQELVGPFDDGFPGFTVAPGRTLSVKVRLAFASGTPQDEVVATAAIVRRHGDNGDWVGQSDDYRFSIEADARTKPEPTSASSAPRRSPAAEALADTGPRAPRGLGTMAGGLLLTAGGLLAASLPLLLYRWRRRARARYAMPGEKEADRP